MAPSAESPDAAQWQRVAFALLIFMSLAIRAWYAGGELSAQRPGFKDEMYNVGNVRSILVNGSLRPVTAFYGSLSYLPQAGLLVGARALGEARGVEDRWVLRERRSRVPTVRWDEEQAEFDYGRRRLRDLSPLAYFLSRLLSCLYGVAALFVLRDIGSRLFSPAVGLTAAFLLAFLPVHLHMSGIFKPDALLVLLVLLILRWTIEVVDEPSTRNYLITGTLIGLAMAAKLNAGISAIPLIVATVMRLRDQRAAWLRLCLAGVVSAGVFWIFNPDLSKVVNALSANLDVYGNRHPAMQALSGEGSRLAGLWNAVWLQLDPRYFGRVLGVVSLAGVVGWIGVLVSSRFKGRHAERLLVLLSLCFGYAVVSAAILKADASAEGSPVWSVYLPITPVACLAAAWLVMRVRRVLPGPAGKVAFLVLLAFLLGWSLVRGLGHLHRYYSPYTAQRDASRLVVSAFAHLDRRLVCTGLPGPIKIVRRSERPAILRMDRLAPSDLTRDSCDVELLPAGWRDGWTSGKSVDRWASRFRGSSLTRFPAVPLRRSGPGIAVVTHPWPEPTEVPVMVAAQGAESVVSMQVDAPENSVISLQFWIQATAEDRGAVALEFAGGPLRLHARGVHKGLLQLNTGRLVIGNDRRFTLRVPSAVEPGSVEVRALLWSPPEA